MQASSLVDEIDLDQSFGHRTKKAPNPDPVKSQRVMQAMLQMDKIDIRRLQEAYEGR